MPLRTPTLGAAALVAVLVFPLSCLQPVVILAATNAAPAQAAQAYESNGSAGSHRSPELAFENRCKTPEIPLDGAPLPALSLDAGVVPPAFTPPYTDARPAGNFTLHLLVNEAGRVVRARIAGSAATRDVDDAVLRWIGRVAFKPRYLDAKAVCAWGTYRMSFESVENDASIAREPPAASPAPASAPAPDAAPTPHASPAPGRPPAPVAADAVSEATDVWAPADVATNALTQRFEARCVGDPRQFNDAPGGAGKLPVKFPSSATLKVPPVPASFRRAHPELQAEAPMFTAVLALLINEEGRVVQARIRRSTGFEELDQVALDAAGGWRMSPALLQGKPACAWGMLGVNLQWQRPG